MIFFGPNAQGNTPCSDELLQLADSFGTSVYCHRFQETPASLVDATTELQRQRSGWVVSQAPQTYHAHMPPLSHADIRSLARQHESFGEFTLALADALRSHRSREQGLRLLLLTMMAACLVGAMVLQVRMRRADEPK